MKSFLLAVGKAAGASLSTVLSALSSGAALPVRNLSIFHLSDSDPDPVIPALTEDLNKAHSLLCTEDDVSLFPSSFVFGFCRPRLPTLQSLSDDSSSSALLSALRGQGIPLSYKTDREAVDWAFSSLLMSGDDSLSSFFSWLENIPAETGTARLALLCDLCDPFSAGTAFSFLRYCRTDLSLPASMISLFCIASRSGLASGISEEAFASSVRAMNEQQLISAADGSGDACADSVWVMSLPSSMVRSEDSYRILYAVVARKLSSFFSSENPPAPGLHTAELPGIVTFQSLGDQAASFVSFLHTASWLLSDIFPSLSAFFDRSAPLRTLTPNTRSGLYRRLFRQNDPSAAKPESLLLFDRVFRAVLSELLNLIRHLPDQLRLAEVSDPLWKEAVDACGRTVTVASEYDVTLAETEESGIMKIKPVHRVSMSDTEEEKQQRRLGEIAEQLKEETENRRLVFERVGGSRARLAVSDCLGRCSSALQRARESVAELTADPQAEKLSLAAAIRRVSLLTAAVHRCEQDLADPSLFPASAGPDSASAVNLSPYSSQMLSASAAEKLSSLLIVSGEESDAVRKELRSLLPSLLFGCDLPDGKTLLRTLLTSCKPDAARQPLVHLILSVYQVSRNAISSLHFLSAGAVPPVPLLPDLCPMKPLVSVSSLLPLLPAGLSSCDTEGEKRGLLAFLLLRQYRRRSSEEAMLSFDEYHPDDSPVVRAWLASQRSDRVCLVSLSSGELHLPVAVILPGKDFFSARLSEPQRTLLPVFSHSWFDNEKVCFTDPCTLISEGDRMLLLDRLDSMLESLPGKEPLSGFLSSFRHDLESGSDKSELPDNLSLLLKSAFGLRLLPAFAHTLERITCYYEHFLTDDTVASFLTSKPAFPASSCNIPDDIVYFYRGVPFARENSRTLMESIPLPAQDWILSLLRQDSRILSASSDLYHDALVRELSLLLERYPSAMPEARQKAFDLLDKANLPVPETVTELSWPWDASSPAVRTILTESLGEKLADAAVRPFSDILVMFPARGNEVVGDSLMSSMCVLAPNVPASEDGSAPSVQADAILPPLSGKLIAALCRLPEGRVLLRPGLLSFSSESDGSVRVTLTLEGSFPVRLIRTYADSELVHLYSHDIPTLAVWPDLPFPPDDWHAYYVYSSLPDGFQFTCHTSDEASAFSVGVPGRNVSCSGVFPLAFSFMKGEQSAGALPNLLPSPDLSRAEEAVACIDFGSSGTSVVLSSGQQRKPLHGPTLVRTLLNNPSCSRDLLRKEFLPAVPVSALLPTASRIFRNVPGADPLPFEDGIILMSSDLQDVLSIPSDSLYACLKWEEEKGRSATLCLHQVMLMTALQARADGVGKLSWRFALPDEMGKEGRERLMTRFLSLAEKVTRTSGFPLPENTPLVTFAAESSALGAYFRLCCSEDTRGGFMVLDIGACTADISLFLRGRELAVRTCQIPLGVHYMLLPVLLHDPSLLSRELGFVQDPAFLQDLSLLEQILNSARSDTAALRKARLALDNFIADRRPILLPALLFNASAGMPTRLGSILLLHFSYLMMLSGLVLLQIAADPGKNDFLPEQMSLCLSGRGSTLLEDLPDPYKTGLWHFLTMFRNRRVASLSLLFSSEKKMEISAGLSVLQILSADLPAPSAVPAAISVRPEELLPQFLLRFRKEFPACAAILFSSFYTNDFYHPFTPYGESLISAAISQSFTEQTALRPYDALSGWIGSLLELLNSPS